MQTWIALLRGINVGGNNILPMKELRTLLERCGFTNVRTYIQSGNCVFEAVEADGAKLSAQIASTIKGKFGFEPTIMALTKTSLEDAIHANPYPQGEDDPKSVHFFFLAAPAIRADMDALEQLRKPSEAFTLTDHVFYLHAPEGIGRSKLAAQAERKLSTRTTARNYRSVIKIMDLAG